MRTIHRLAALALLANLSCQGGAGAHKPGDPDAALGYRAKLARVRSGHPVPDDPAVQVRPTTDLPGITPFRLPEHARVYKRCAGAVVVVFTMKLDGDTLVDHAMGTGFIVSKSGFVVTNRHVVEGADAVSVLLKDPSMKSIAITEEYQRRFSRTAVPVGIGSPEDLAVLKILRPPDTLTALDLAASSDVEPALDVLAIGHPEDFALAPGDALVSFWDFAPGMVRNVQKKGGYSMLVRHTTPINRGNSGGPLLNLDGKVVGVNTMKPPRDAEQDGVFWSIGVEDVAAFLKKHDAYLKKDFGMASGRSSIEAMERIEPVNLGFIGPGQKAAVKFRIKLAGPEASIAFGYEGAFALLTRDGRQWLVHPRSGAGWGDGVPRKLAAGDWHELVYTRKDAELGVEIDGQAIPSPANPPARGWGYLFLRGVEADVERP